MEQTNDLRVASTRRLITPRALKAALPMTNEANATVVSGRATVKKILDDATTERNELEKEMIYSYSLPNTDMIG